MRLKTPIMRLDLRNYSDMYIVVKDRTTIEGDNLINRRYEKLTFKNISPFRSCISKINNTFVDSTKVYDSANEIVANVRLKNKKKQQVNILSIRQK